MTTDLCVVGGGGGRENCQVLRVARWLLTWLSSTADASTRPRLHLQGSAGCSKGEHCLHSPPRPVRLRDAPARRPMSPPRGPRCPSQDAHVPSPWPSVPRKESADVCASLGPGCRVGPECCPLGPPLPALSCVPARGRCPTAGRTKQQTEGGGGATACTAGTARGCCQGRGGAGSRG